MTIGCNKYQFYGKIVAVFFVVIIFSFFIYNAPHIKFNDAPAGAIVFLFIIWALMLLLFIIMILQLIILPKEIVIDEEDKTLTLKFLFAGSTTLGVNDLLEYSAMTIATRSGSYEGVLVTVTGGKEYLISNFSLEDYTPVKTFLEDAKIEFLGQEKFDFMSYFYRYIRS